MVPFMVRKPSSLVGHIAADNHRGGRLLVKGLKITDENIAVPLGGVAHFIQHRIAGLALRRTMPSWSLKMDMDSPDCR